MKQTKKRVLFITNIPSPYRVDFFNELGKYCDLTVIFERKSSDDRSSEWHKYNFDNFNGVFLKSLKVGANRGFTFSVIKYINLYSKDTIIVGGYATPTGMFAITYLNFKKIPFILNSDGGFINRDEKFVKRHIKKYFISSADTWLSTGEETNAYLKYYGANPLNIEVYPFTTMLEKDLIRIQVSKNLKISIKEELNIREEKIVLSIGQFVHRKGLDVLIKASENLPKDIGIVIIGGKPTIEYINLKEKLNLTNLYFVDFQNKESLKKYFTISDIFVLPTREDIWGLVINEAMANGLPIITTNRCVAGIELVKNEDNGFIVPVNDDIALYKSIAAIINDEKKLLSMSNSSLKKIKPYTLENMAKTIYQIINHRNNKGMRI